MKSICLFVTLCITAAVPVAADDSVVYTIAGKVVDAMGAPIENAVVVLCDDESGIPLNAGTQGPFTDSLEQNTEILFRVTGSDGAFQFEGMRNGKYKLVAQSWPEATEPITEIMRMNGPTLRICGYMRGVQAKDDRSRELMLRPLGTGRATITTAPAVPNDDAILLLSTKSPIGDPILAFWSWGPSFTLGCIGASAMKHGALTIEGLPEGKVHASVFANDNNPGFGAGSLVVKGDAESTLVVNLVAGWSDGFKTPTGNVAKAYESLGSVDEARAFVDTLESNLPESTQAKHFGDLLTLNGGYDKKVELPNGTECRIADALAAALYYEFHAER